MDSGSKMPLALAIGGVLGTCVAVKYYFDKDKTNGPSGQQTKKSVTTGDNLITIYFGSQTGTAETFAEELSDHLRELGLKTEIIDLDEFDENTFIKKEYVIFIQSTYGEGDPTDSSVDFFEWLENISPDEEYLTNMKYAVFGCGSKQYPDYNQAAKTLDEALETNGATRLFELGLGDDDADLMADFNQWLELVPKPFCDHLNPTDQARRNSCELERKALPLTLRIDPDGQKLPRDMKVMKEGNDTLAKWIFQSYDVPISNIRQLRSKVSDTESTVHVDVDISKSRLIYNAADTAEVLPHNSAELVRRFAAILQCEHQMKHFIAWSRSELAEKESVKSPFPTPCTLEQALTQFCDLTMLPGKSTLIQIAKNMSPLPTEASAVLDGKDILDLAKARMTFLEFWETYFSGHTISLGDFLQLCPRQRMRPYTISTSPKERSKIMGLTVGLVTETLDPIKGLAIKTLEKERNFQGLCSSWLTNNDAPPERMRIAIRTSAFSLPANRAAPLIMIGCGTGLAPFRGFIQELAKREVKPVRSLLFFGCRHPDEDFIYRDELEDCWNHVPDLRMICAFSRQQEHKVYVQDKISEYGEEVADMLSKGGFLYVCGGNNMGKAVEATLDKILTTRGEKKLSVQSLKKSKRYYEELWG